MSASEASRPSPLQTLVIGQILIGTASWATLIAIQTKASYELDQQALYLAAIAMAWGAPTILLSSVVGRLIDRRGPRTVGLAASALSVAASLGLVLVDSVPALWALTLISGVGRAFAQPAADAMPSWLPGPAEHVKSSVWLGFATSVPMIAGPAMAASLVAAWGTTSAFTANAIAYLLGGAVFLALRPCRTHEQQAQADGRRISMRTLLTARTVRTTIVLTAIVWASYGALGPLEILYIKDVLHEPASTFATIEIAFGSGLLAATLLIARFNALLSRRFFLPLSVLLVGAGEMLYSATHSLTFAYVGIGLWGLAAGMFGPACRLALLNATPVDRHGQAMALWRAVQSFGSLAPPTAAAAAAHFAGVQATLLAVGSLVVVTGALACTLTATRSLRGHTETDPTDRRREKV